MDTIQYAEIQAKAIPLDRQARVPQESLTKLRQDLGCSDDVDARIQAHKSGNGSKTMAAVQQAGIGWKAVRWED
jgi:hypothetical protein